MSFQNDLKRFRIKTELVLDKVYRASLFDLTTAIIQGTPVDKGILRNNWFVQIGVDDLVTKTNRAAPVGTATIGRAKAELAPVTIGETVYIFNNLPYGPRIEFDGWSGKAPEGMVRINVIRWDTIVANNARRFR